MIKLALIVALAILIPIAELHFLPLLFEYLPIALILQAAFVPTPIQAIWLILPVQVIWLILPVQAIWLILPVQAALEVTLVVIKLVFVIIIRLLVEGLPLFILGFILAVIQAMELAIFV